MMFMSSWLIFLCIFIFLCLVHVIMDNFRSPPWHLALFFVSSILFMSSWINSLDHPGIVPALWGPDHVLCSFGWCRSFGGTYQLSTDHCSEDVFHSWHNNYRTRVRSLFTLVTDWLTNSLLFSKLYWCDPGVWRCQLQLVDVVTVADDDRAGNTLLQIWKLRSKS